MERQMAMLTKDSSNSPKPPSSDGPGIKPKTQASKKSGKKKEEANQVIREAIESLLQLKMLTRYFKYIQTGAIIVAQISQSMTQNASPPANSGDVK